MKITMTMKQAETVRNVFAKAGRKAAWLEKKIEAATNAPASTTTKTATRMTAKGRSNGRRTTK